MFVCVKHHMYPQQVRVSYINYHGLEGKEGQHLASYNAMYTAGDRRLTMVYDSGFNTGIICPSTFDVADKTKLFIPCYRHQDRPGEPPCHISYFTKRQ